MLEYNAKIKLMEEWRRKPIGHSGDSLPAPSPAHGDASSHGRAGSLHEVLSGALVRERSNRDLRVARIEVQGCRHVHCS